MKRRKLFLLTVLTLGAVAGPSAFAERLGGAYRGPEDVQTSSKDTGQSTGGSDAEGPDGASRDSGGSGDSSGGLGSGGDSGSGGSGGGSGSGGDSGSGGGSSPPPSSGSGGGGGDIGGGGDSSGSTARGGGSTEKKSGGGGGGGGTATRGKGGADSAQEQLMVVSWYFEHNRERLISEVAEARNRRIRPHRGSVAALLSMVPRDMRERSDVTVEDREKIYDVLRKNVTANEDVVRDAAVIALGKVGTPDAVQVLRTRLEEESKSDIREDIVLALGIARSPEAIDALAGVLKSNRTHLHPYALLALGLTQDAERAGPILLEHLPTDLKRGKAGQDDASAAVMALGALRHAPAEPVLLAAAKAKSTPDFVKVYLAHALGRFGSEDARKAVETLAGSSDEDVARAAVLALGNFADASVTKALKEGLGRPDPLSAGFAALSLGKVLSAVPESDWKKIPDDLREVAMSPQKSSIKSQYANLALSFFPGGFDTSVRKRYAEEMKNGSKLPSDVIAAMAMACGVGTVTGFEASLKDIAEGSGFDPKLRGYAALSLGMTGDPSTTAPVLRKIYQGADSNPDVQRGAVLALGLVGDRKDVPFLMDVIVRTDKSRAFANYTRGAAVMALGLIRDGESVSRIQDMLRSPDALVRAYAIATLGYIADKDASPVMPQIFEHANFRQEFRALKVAMRTL